MRRVGWESVSVQVVYQLPSFGLGFCGWILTHDPAVVQQEPHEAFWMIDLAGFVFCNDFEPASVEAALVDGS